MYDHADAALTRRWVAVVALPALAAVSMFYLSRTIEEPYDGWAFSTGLCFVVLAATLGPLVCLSYRARETREQADDERADLRYQVRRLETNLEAVSHAMAALIESRPVGYMDMPTQNGRLYALPDPDGWENTN